MDYVLKFIVLISLTLLGGLLFALTINLLIMSQAIPSESLNADFGREITHKAIYVWLGSIILGIVSIFIKQKWRYVLLISPLILPSLFAFIYSLSV